MISVEELEKFHPEKYQRNDIGTSNLFTTVYAGSLVYVVERKGFFVYDGKVWRKDVNSLQTHEFAKEFVLSILNYFDQKSLDDENITKYYAKYLNRRNRCRLIEDAQSINPVKVEKFDSQPYLVNCQNCTVNLTTGEAHKHDPLDYLTKISNVWFDPEADSGEFKKFISAIMLDNQELIDYLQQALGYSLSAATFQECFFITYGATTRNGKGTLNSTMLHMLGDYGKAAPYEVFESKKYKTNGGASEDLARLAGSRYVSVSEPAEGITLDSALIKTLSGNDRVTARNLYENSFEFTATFKIWINTNHLPVIPDDTVFKSGRVQLIPFNKHFSEEEQDRGLKARLTSRANIAGAFNWCMKGFQLMAEKGGLTIPAIIREEVEKYRQENDRLGAFMKECFLIKDMDGKDRVKLSTVYKIYVNWCKENGIKAWNKKNFKKKLGERVTVQSYGGQDCIVGYCIEPNLPSWWYI